MLLVINIENMAVIKSAELEFENGLNVLTGETGAGKSILIDSINLLLGERMERGLIRFGESRATVSGLFNISSENGAFFEELGFSPEEDGSLLVQREIFADGRNVCRVNGKMTTVSSLKQLGRHLISIHGQHDNQALLDHRTHIDFLDAFATAGGGFTAAEAEYAAHYSKLRAAQAEYASLCEDESEKLRRIDILKYELDELTAADLSLDEEEELKRRLDIINGARELAGSISAAHALLYEDEALNAYSVVSSAAARLSDAAEIDGALSPLAEEANGILIGIEELSRSVSHYMDGIDLSGEGLDEIEERLDVIYKMKRKYGGTVASAIAALDAVKKEYESIITSDERKARLETEVAELTAGCAELSDRLTRLRKDCAPTLEKGINDTLGFLDMSGARFSVSLEKLTDFSPKGIDRVEFLISTNTGEPQKPLAKIISGGELSRIMLAIKSILPTAGVEPAMIFDEIDTGVSGRAAQRIGIKLSSLASGRQILCVTHLAQIAAVADRHFKIEKSERDGKTYTSVSVLDKDGRVNEIARIIGGDAISGTTLRQAEEMINHEHN